MTRLVVKRCDTESATAVAAAINLPVSDTAAMQKSPMNELSRVKPRTRLPLVLKAPHI
jgi:hypothetical protein